MGRPESPITGDGPVAELARALRALRARAGQPSYRKMAENCLSRFSLLAEAARGRTCPTWEVLCDYVTACGERPADWRELWDRAHKTPWRRRRAATRRPSSTSGTTAVRAPAQPSAPSAPDPWQATSAREFVLALRELRAWSGQRSYYGVTAAAETRLAKSTMYDALNPNREYVPPLEIVRAIVTACRADVETWTQAWQRLRLQEHHQAPLPTRPSVGRRDSFSRPTPGPAAHRPLGERSGELAKPDDHVDQWAAVDAVLEDFERLRISRSYPDPAPAAGAEDTRREQPV